MRRFRVGKLEGSADDDDQKTKGILFEGSGSGGGGVNTSHAIREIKGMSWKAAMMRFKDSFRNLRGSGFIVAAATFILISLAPTSFRSAINHHIVDLPLPIPPPLSTIPHFFSRPIIDFNWGSDVNNHHQAFLHGLLLAFSVTLLMALGVSLFIYDQFSKSLKHERDVFSYPSVIKRR